MIRILNSSKIFLLISLILIIFNIVGAQDNNTLIKTKIKTIGDIHIPNGYLRVSVEENSFSEWIRKLPLKPNNSVVLDYKGRIFKSKNDTTVGAVVDWDIKGKRLEQCMDILVRFYL